MAFYTILTFHQNLSRRWRQFFYIPIISSRNNRNNLSIPFFFFFLSPPFVYFQGGPSILLKQTADEIITVCNLLLPVWPFLAPYLLGNVTKEHTKIWNGQIFSFWSLKTYRHNWDPWKQLLLDGHETTWMPSVTTPAASESPLVTCQKFICQGPQ